ncbi:MAG: LptF/LptG family permease [Opitutales bacterium]|nr:LptF/LptG family permease [Opitutales bacterium]
MTLLDRYIFREWLIVFALTLFAVLGLLVLDDVQSNLPDLLAAEVGVEVIWQYYFLTLPTYIPSVVPLALLVSLLFALGRMHRYHEFTAMRAAGLGLFRITRTLWVTGFALAGLLFYLNGDWIPRSMESARELREGAHRQQIIETAGADSAASWLYNLTFYNHRAGRLWFINRLDEVTYRAHGVTVSEVEDSGARETRRWAANEAYFDDILGHWVFLQGRETTFDADSGRAVRSRPFAQQNMEGFAEDPQLMKFLEKRPRDLSFFELHQLITTLSADEDARVADYQRQYFEILLSPLSVIIIVAIAVPFAIGGVRTDPMVGVSKSLGLFVIYYVSLNVARFVGHDIFSPALAAFVPNAVMLLLAIYFFRKATRPV